MKKPILNLLSIKHLTIDSKKAFSILAGINRPIYPRQVTKIAESIKKMGVIRPIVVAKISFISGKTEYYIIDGQHLFNALIRLNLPIPYTEVTVTDKQDLVEKIALLNASSKNWCMQDYITAWSSLKEDYVKLNRYFEVYDLERTFLASVLMNFDAKSISVKIKKGDFKITEEKQAVRILDQVTDMLHVLPRMNRFENSYSCYEYVKFFKSIKDYDHNRFIKNLIKHKKEFLLATQEEGKLSEMFKKLK